MHENTNDDEPRLIDLLKILEGFESDLILVEGFKAEKFPKIELYRKDIAKDLLCTSDDSIIAVASDFKIEKNIGLTNLDINNPKQIVDYIIKYLGIEK
jgi:molybdopterin-guanine dinucleotide biosynthesis protein B